MTAPHFPEALNQGHATLSQVLRGVAIILYACVFVGIVGYMLTLIALGFRAAFAKHLSFRVMHRASMAVGFAFAALIPLYQIPFFCIDLRILLRS